MATGARISKLSSSLLLRIRPLSSASLSVPGRVIGLSDPPTRNFGSRWFSSEPHRPSFKISIVSKPFQYTMDTLSTKEKKKLPPGCDFKHWLVVTEAHSNKKTREEIIDSYVKTLTKLLESEEEAKKAIYSVSTKYYFAFGCVLDEELSWKLRNLSEVRYVFPDSYLDVKKKDYGGEPFIDGKAVPYDPKYHEEWLQNNEKRLNRPRKQLITNRQVLKQDEETQSALTNSTVLSPPLKEDEKLASST